MNNILITTKSNQFLNVFLNSYKKNNGILFKEIIFMPERNELGFSLFEKPIVAFKVAGILGSVKLFSIKYIKALVSVSDINKGVLLRIEDLLPSVAEKWSDLDSLNQEDLNNKLLKLSPDVLISLGAPVIFSKEILDIPKILSLNIHGGYIPKYRGHFSSFWEVHNKEKYGYVSIHKMSSDVDKGELYALDEIKMNKIPTFVDLLIMKKSLAGVSLSKILKQLQNDGFSMPVSTSITGSNYYNWPSLKDILNFTWHKF